MTLHIYGQYTYHDDVEISGTKESLEKLREALNRALYKGYYSFEDTVNDGEGYNVYLNMLSEEEMDAIKDLPYIFLKEGVTNE